MSHKASAKAGVLFHAKMTNIAIEPEGQRKVHNANATLPPFEPKQK